MHREPLLVIIKRIIDDLVMTNAAFIALKYRSLCHRPQTSHCPRNKYFLRQSHGLYSGGFKGGAGQTCCIIYLKWCLGTLFSPPPEKTDVRR